MKMSGDNTSPTPSAKSGPCFKLSLEAVFDGQVSRFEHSCEMFDNDNCDGAKTVGNMMALIPEWINSVSSGGIDFATMAYCCMYYRGEGSLFREIGKANEAWGASHEFEECVKLDIDRDKLSCDAMECSHSSNQSAAYDWSRDLKKNWRENLRDRDDNTTSANGWSSARHEQFRETERMLMREVIVRLSCCDTQDDVSKLIDVAKFMFPKTP